MSVFIPIFLSLLLFYKLAKFLKKPSKSEIDFDGTVGIVVGIIVFLIIWGGFFGIVSYNK